ncbi:tRNA (N6-threonylcarbamoyladenosine(37)-N6)-methyltransferase TrmO [Methanoplanus sp. FWC-SCC4]|uniref:tRNA (N6-threonylcarbamoyladenosine(37)-N6)-methyltransferase TrmO n=1 Tax=Methanochimaera problematica TaxID=2609417 RepID=A0AA97FDU1_9EURY|nr:tRNA (N6-threonylcarbamoyladenosine(37)-N6)-methyltransferase TrmO [Methanoplanus sp. FWC-SCC4]WOF16443.1 tRNA (N6-threonylcarbamoyladenosine(37)-N6)-methyltransferase TrmO [Methanoplanus sp. FWC-SCC4]
MNFNGTSQSEDKSNSATETNITLNPIGIIRNNTTKPVLFADEKGLRINGDNKAAIENFHEVHEGISEIVIKDELSELLEGIEDYSHLIIIYWGHGITKEGRSLKRVHPMGMQKNPLTGVYSTCSPARPNPVLMTVVRLQKREGNVLTVSGLDAIDKSPVIDIKPYVSKFYPQDDIKIPNWMQKIIEEY